MAFFSKKSRTSASKPGLGNATPPVTRTPPSVTPTTFQSASNLEPKPTLTDISEAAIRARAHQIWLARGDAPGDDLADWLRAESELKQEIQAIENSARQGGTT